MKPIDTSGISPSPRVETDRRTGGAKVDSSSTASSSAAKSRPVSDDTVELTDTASKLSQLRSEVEAADGVNLDRVEAIRNQIAEGSYSVDPERIADALIKLEQELMA